MSLEERAREAEEETGGTSTVGRVAPWFALGLIAVVVLELFGHPLLAASVLCLKFALNDFLTALWFVRTDPDRGRGWACGLLYTAAGFWKAAVINYGIFTAAVVYTLVAGEPAWPQRPANAPAPDFLDDPLTPWAAPTVFGHAIEFFLGMVALGIAYARRQKLWLSPRLHVARKARAWPPDDDRGVNWLRWPPAVSAATVPVAFWAVGFPLLAFVAPPPGINTQDWEVVFSLHSFFAFILALPVVLLAACVHDKTRPLVAESPAACWGEPNVPWPH